MVPVKFLTCSVVGNTIKFVFFSKKKKSLRIPLKERRKPTRSGPCLLITPIHSNQQNFGVLSKISIGVKKCSNSSVLRKGFHRITVMSNCTCQIPLLFSLKTTTITEEKDYDCLTILVSSSRYYIFKNIPQEVDLIVS